MNLLRRKSMAPVLILGLAILLLMLLSGAYGEPPAARADAGPALEETTVIGSSLSPYKFKRTQVRMLDEQVQLKITPVTTEQIIYNQIEVQADFHMHNTSAITESMQAVFPLTELQCPWIAGPGSWTFRESAIDTPSFAVSIDGQAVATTPLTTTTIITPKYNGGFTGPTMECHTQWKQFAAVFPPHRDVRIKVNYRMLPTFDLGTGMEGYPWDSFTYIFTSGAPWYGSIGAAELSIELPKPVHKEDFLKLPAGYHIQQNTIRWRWQNLEPRENFKVVMMSLETQKDLAEIQKKIDQKPDDGAAWAELAKTYEALAGRYDYAASCGSDLSYASFAQIQNWEYAALARQAYLRSIELRPKDAETLTNYASLLAKISLSGNNGVVMAEYPTVQRASQAFEQALAPGPDEQAQRLFDSFKHCIVKSKDDPPVCYCGF